MADEVFISDSDCISLQEIIFTFGRNLIEKLKAKGSLFTCLFVIFSITSLNVLIAQPKYYYSGKLSFQDDNISRRPLKGIIIKTSGSRTSTDHHGVFQFNSLQSGNVDLSFELPDTLKLARYEGNTVAVQTFSFKTDNIIDWIVIKKRDGKDKFDQVLDEIQEVKIEAGQIRDNSEIARRFFGKMSSDRVSMENMIKRNKIIGIAQSNFDNNNYHAVITLLEDEKVEIELATSISNLEKNEYQAAENLIVANSLLARSYVLTNRYLDADRILKLLFSLTEVDFERRLSLLSFLFEKKLYDKVIKQLKVLDNDDMFLDNSLNAAKVDALYGYAYVEMGSFDKAKSHLERASSEFEKLNLTRANKYLLESAKAHAYLARVHVEIGLFGAADKNLRFSNDILQLRIKQAGIGLKARESIAHTTLIIGMAYHNLSHISNAKAKYSEAKRLYRELRVLDPQSYISEYLSCIANEISLSDAFEYRRFSFSRQSREEHFEDIQQVKAILDEFQLDPHRDVVLYDLHRILATERDSPYSDQEGFSILESDVSLLKVLVFDRPWMIDKFIHCSLALARLDGDFWRNKKRRKILLEADHVIEKINSRYPAFSNFDYSYWKLQLHIAGRQLLRSGTIIDDYSYHLDRVTDYIESLPNFSYTKYSDIYYFELYRGNTNKKILRTDETCQFLLYHLNEISTNDSNTTWHGEFEWIHNSRLWAREEMHEVIQSRHSKRYAIAAYTHALGNLEYLQNHPRYPRLQSIQDLQRYRYRIKSVKIRKQSRTEMILNANDLGHGDLAERLASNERLFFYSKKRKVRRKTFKTVFRNMFSMFSKSRGTARYR